MLNLRISISILYIWCVVIIPILKKFMNLYVCLNCISSTPIIDKNQMIVVIILILIQKEFVLIVQLFI